MGSRAHHPFPDITRTPPLWCFLGFYPFFASTEAGPARQALWGGKRVAAGSHRSMQTTFPTQHVFAAGAAWLLADIRSLYIFIAWSCVI